MPVPEAAFSICCWVSPQGLLGMAYNWTLLAGISLADRIHWPVEYRAAVIGGLVGAVACSLQRWLGAAITSRGTCCPHRRASRSYRCYLPCALCWVRYPMRLEHLAACLRRCSCW